MYHVNFPVFALLSDSLWVEEGRCHPSGGNARESARTCLLPFWSQGTRQAVSPQPCKCIVCTYLGYHSHGFSYSPRLILETGEITAAVQLSVLQRSWYVLLSIFECQCFDSLVPLPRKDGDAVEIPHEWSSKKQDVSSHGFNNARSYILWDSPCGHRGGVVHLHLAFSWYSSCAGLCCVMVCKHGRMPCHLVLHPKDLDE